MASCGVASRRQCERLIEEGRVRVDGHVASLGESIEPGKNEVLVDGRSLTPAKKVYILLHKPAGLITTAKDTHGRGTVMDCVKETGARVFPVGRLDRDVEGALLMTNDGELAYRLTHPSYEAPKTYLAWVRGAVNARELERLRAGVPLEDGRTAPANASVRRRAKGRTLLRLVLTEGRKREVKRMCSAIGHPVESLRRPSFAGLTVKGLAPGAWRWLSPREVRSLRAQVGLTERTGGQSSRK